MAWENFRHSRHPDFWWDKRRRVPSTAGRESGANIFYDINSARIQAVTKKVRERSARMATKVRAIVDDNIERPASQGDCLIEQHGIVLRATHEMKTLVSRK